MSKILKFLHLWGIYRRICTILINHVFINITPISNRIRCKLLRSLGYHIGKGTTVVAPIYILGTVEIGENCWINRGFTIHGNGHVRIGNNCDIAPEVVFLTGGHEIGIADRRAGKGINYSISVGDGTWIGARSTIMKNTQIGTGCVIAACACVIKNVPDNTLVGGVPAKEIRRLDGE